MSWLRQERELFDWQVMPTYVPQTYGLHTPSLYGHLKGIDTYLQSRIAPAQYLFPGGDYLHSDGVNLFWTSPDGTETIQLTFRSLMHQQVTVNNLPTEFVPTPGVAGRPVAVSEEPVGVGTIDPATRYLLIHVQNGAVRLSYGGEDPSASTGFLHPAGTFLQVKAQSAAFLKFIRATANDAALYIQEMTR